MGYRETLNPINDTHGNPERTTKISKIQAENLDWSDVSFH